MALRPHHCRGRIAALALTAIALGWAISDVAAQGPLDPRLQPWADKILAQTTHNPVAFGIGPEMMKQLPPAESLAVVQSVWPATGQQSVKTALLKTFTFGRHPDVLQVLHLGMMDSDPAVQEYADSYLKYFALRSFAADRAAYLQWYAKYGIQPLERVLADTYRRLAGDIRNIDPAVALKIFEEFDVDFGMGKRKSSRSAARKAAADTDLADTIVGWFENDLLDKETEHKAARLLRQLPVDEEFAAKRILPLTEASHTPHVRVGAAVAIASTLPDVARARLLELLQSTVADSATREQELVRREVCFALSELGDPKSVAPMIAIMDSDNSTEVCRAIGRALCEFKLGELTGANPNAFADGQWWRKWWDENKHRLPAEAQKMVIAELPKTKHGKTYKPRDVDIDSHAGQVQIFREEFAKFESGRKHDLWSAASAFAEADDPRAIPFLIGAIDADNSYDTVYGVGYFGLGKGKLGELTGVEHSPFHDGAWWRRWWEENKTRFSEEAQAIPIAQFPKTKHGKHHVPFPQDLDTHEGRVRFVSEQLKKPDVDLTDLAELFNDAGDPRGIPVLIGVIGSWPNKEANYDIGYFGLSLGKLGKLTRVSYDAAHDGLWWQAWWATHRRDFPTAADVPIPEFTVAATARPKPLADVADVPAKDIRISADANKRYFLIGDASRQAPQEGFKLLVVMAGGDGGEGFHPFVRRIYKHALDDSWLVAQPVSVWWNKDQEIVWPTKANNVEGAKFTTEQFVEMVVADVKSKANIDAKNVITLTWSSSGPAAYAIAFQPTKSVTASYIAMSVFRPQ